MAVAEVAAASVLLAAPTEAVAEVAAVADTPGGSFQPPHFLRPSLLLLVVAALVERLLQSTPLSVTMEIQELALHSVTIFKASGA